MKKLDDILGKVIALTKNINLKEHTPLECSFMSGKTPSRPYGVGGITLWCTPSVGPLIKAISYMAIDYDATLEFGNIEGFDAVIKEALKDNVFNDNLFDNVKIWERKADTLFAARRVEDVKEFAKRVWEVIYKAMVQEPRDWLVVYPLYRMSIRSGTIGFDGLSILEPKDRDIWEQIASKYAAAKEWSPETGASSVATDRLFGNGPPETWLLCEISGTEGGAVLTAGDHMKTFVTVLLSVLYGTDPRVLHRSMAGPFSYSVQFCEQKRVDRPIGTILHPLLSRVEVPDQAIREVTEWYKSRASGGDEKGRRASVASLFLHNSMMANGTQKFIQLFIALDALFGVRGRVEATITDGVEKAFPGDNQWGERAQQLFELRSELVHGGCSRIDAWKGLEHYRGHFKTEPLRDVTVCAMACIRQYFRI